MTPLTPIKGKPWIYLLLLAGVLLLMFFLKQCTSMVPDEGDGLPPDKHAGGDTLEVAIEIAPMSLNTSGDTLSGTYYNLMRDIARAEGVAVKFTPFSSVSTALEGVENGRYDILIADQPVIAAMRDRFLFTDPVGLDQQLLIQRRGNDGKPPIRSILQLRGDTIWLPAGSPFANRIRNLGREIGDTIYVITDSKHATEQLIMLTAIGEIPRTVANERAFRDIAPRYPELDASVEVSLTQFQSWVVAKNRPELRDSLNIWLKRHQSAPAER